jgi:hypothetical protein
MAECNQCDRSFRSTQALFAHCRDKDDHPFCEDCDRLFSTFQGLDQVLLVVLYHLKGSDSRVFYLAHAKCCGTSQ